MVCLVTCKNEEDPSNNEGTAVVTTFYPLEVNGYFSRHSRAAYSTVQGLIWPIFAPIRDFMSALVACKNKEDPIENEGGRVVTTLFIDFLDAQVQQLRSQ